MTYRDTTIERDHRGFYLASPLVANPDPPGDYFRPVQADTLDGVKRLIDESLDGGAR